MAGDCPINGYVITKQSGIMQIYKIKGFSLVCILVLQMLAVQLNYASAAPAQPEMRIAMRDIRVIIDVSGSMKKNDPDNHRSKAIQLFSEILPPDLTVGIWTFAAEVNMLVKHRQIDKAWKESAFKKAKKIHSHGLYTNIEKALKVATRGLTKEDLKKEQHVILLTDGYVDISKNTGINKDSRQRIVEDLLPKLQSKQVIVHTIALSQHADHDLLKTLSHKTTGQYMVIENASDLDRYFFKLFQATTKPDTVPLKNNSFEIDSAVKDMTVVLFNSEFPSELITPKNEKWSSKSHPGNVKWVKSDNYEIITVSDPEVGSWGINAPIDPDNKIMVVTNIRLHVNKLPVLLMPEDELHIEAFLTEDEKIITKDEFIKLLYLKSVVKKRDSLGRITIDIQHKGDGVFKADAGLEGLDDQSVLLVTAKSPTFTREYRHEFTVVSNPVIVESKLVDDKYFNVVAYIDERVIDKDKFKLELKDQHGVKVFEPIGNNWKLELPASYSGEKITFTVNALLHNNKNFSQNVVHRLPEIQQQQVAHHQEPVVDSHEVADEHAKMKHDEHTVDKPETHEEDPDGGSLNWIIVTIAVILANILLGVGGYYIYKKVFKSKHDDDFMLLDPDVDSSQGTASAEAVEDMAGLEDIEDMDDIESVVSDTDAKPDAK